MSKSKIQAYFEENGKILNLLPNFVPRQFCKAGHRLRLHPDDYFACGVIRGEIKERWFSSVIAANNGPLAPADEAMSYVNTKGDGTKEITLKEFVDTLKADLIGPDLYKKYGTWPMYSKFYDYEAALFHHLHLDFEAAARVGKLGKPEAYYYPPQYNPVCGRFPHTYFGFDPDVKPEEVKERLAHFEEADTRITELSRAFRIELGTGWYTAPGVIHAPGSFLTYEPQWNSDVNSVFENNTDGEVYSMDILNENCPEDKKRDLDYIMSLLDWKKNVDPHYRKHYFRPPLIIEDNPQYTEKWVVYGNDYIAAKELTVHPGQTAVIKDPTPYGCILTQGYGKLGKFDCATATMLRFGQASQDEFFVSYDAATKGVKITNYSHTEPLVMLKHFPNNPSVPTVDMEN